MNRPVVLTVERKTDLIGKPVSFYTEAEFVISSMRQMNWAECAWLRLKRLFTSKHKTDTTPCSVRCTADLPQPINIGMELSVPLWKTLVCRDVKAMKAWNWMDKYSHAVMKPVLPASIPLMEYEEGV